MPGRRRWSWEMTRKTVAREEILLWEWRCATTNERWWEILKNLVVDINSVVEYFVCVLAFICAQQNNKFCCQVPKLLKKRVPSYDSSPSLLFHHTPDIAISHHWFCGFVWFLPVICGCGQVCAVVWSHTPAEVTECDSSEQTPLSSHSHTCSCHWSTKMEEDLMNWERSFIFEPAGGTVPSLLLTFLWRGHLDGRR